MANPDAKPRPTVLLHGFAGHPEDWQAVVEAAPKLAEAVALPLPGHLDQTPPRSFADAVDRLALSLPEGPMNLVGYSMGGRLALGLTAQWPERIDRLVLVAAHTGLLDVDARKARLERDSGLAARLRAEPEPFFEWWDSLPMFHGTAAPDMTAWRARRSAHNPLALADTMVRLSLGRMPHLGTVIGSHPRVILVVGSRDQRFRDHYASLSRRHPQVPVHVVPGAAHRILADAPDVLGPIIGAALNGEKR